MSRSGGINHNPSPDVFGWALGIVSSTLLSECFLFLGTWLIDFPLEFDPTRSESLKTTIHLFDFKHFQVFLLAFALGAFCGARVLGRFLQRNHALAGLGLGLLQGFIAYSSRRAFPLWFMVLGCVCCVLGGGLGGKLAGKRFHAREEARFAAVRSEEERQGI